MGVGLVIGVILFLIPFFFNAITQNIRTIYQNRMGIVIFIVTGIVIFSLTFWFGFYSKKSTVHWILPKFFLNVKESFQVYSQLKAYETQPIDSTYYDYLNLKLDYKPNIYLFMIESYGKILSDHPKLKTEYQKMMIHFENCLGKEGWITSTNYSEAPISGGLSWLSIATVFYGIKIKDQAIYTHIMNNRNNLPGFLQFLHKQGYHTFNLQPLNRVRAGYSLKIYDQFFNFDVPIYFDDLDFNAEKYGFDFISDQYSLNYTHKKFIEDVDDPHFLFFITLSSHYPWNNIPRYNENWKNISSEVQLEKKISQQLRTTFRRRFISDTHYLNYLKAIKYEFEVLTDYIIKLNSPNAIFILLGDHQPPLITKDYPSFYTPIHIISRDITLIEAFKTFGFSDGMFKDTNESANLKHEGIYSLIVHILAQQYSTISTSKEKLPLYKPMGIALSILR
jgi:hypothetical protein